MILKKARTANPSATTMCMLLSLLPSDRCLFCEKTRIQGNNMLKTLVKCMAKTAEDSAKEETKRKQDQHILLKVQDLAVREAYYHATCRKDYTREDDRHQETIKDTKTIKEQASNKTIQKWYDIRDIVQNISFTKCNQFYYISPKVGDYKDLRLLEKISLNGFLIIPVGTRNQMVLVIQEDLLFSYIVI